MSKFSERKSQNQHFYYWQGSILITLTCSPAHRLAPASHSVVVTWVLPSPELTQSGAESLGHSDAFLHTHFLSASAVKKHNGFIQHPVTYTSCFWLLFWEKKRKTLLKETPWQIVPGWQSSQDVNLFSGHRQLLSLVNTKFWPIHRRAPSLQTSSTILRFARSVAHSCREVLKEDNTQKWRKFELGFINRWSISNVLNTEMDISLRALIRHFTDTLILSQSLP